MNNKPFWQGKTCKEMAGLHVKVTFNSGTIVTGVTNMNGDIPEADNLSGREGNEKFVPYDYVKSIELLDDPEYERIDNIEDVRKGDEVFTLSGNKYKARAVYESMEVYADGDGFIPIIQQVETTGDVKRLCIEAKTDGRIDAMSCQLIDPHTGGVK